MQPTLTEDFARFLKEESGLDLNEPDSVVLSNRILEWMALEYDRQIDKALGKIGRL